MIWSCATLIAAGWHPREAAYRALLDERKRRKPRITMLEMVVRAASSMANREWSTGDEHP